MKVYVVTGGDYPAAVHDDEEAATARVREESAKNSKRKMDGYRPIYWNYHEFVLQES